MNSVKGRYLSQDEIKKAYSNFTFKDNKDGSITVDPIWIKANIVSVKTPIAVIQCHKKVKDVMVAAITECALYFDISDFKKSGGVWVPRHTLWDKTKPLSRHSWGIAIDVNVSKNCYGIKPNQPQQLIQAFKSRGFVWGGDWKTPDGMHFEIGILT